MKKPRKPRPRKIDLILDRPDYVAAIAITRENNRADDILLLDKLVKRLDGRHPRPLAARLQRCFTRVYRDPRDVAYRFLRRFREGDWYRGGSHVARYHGGPGIGFRNFRNDRHQKIQPILLDR